MKYKKASIDDPYWLSQRYEWDCGLVSLRCILRFLGLNISENKMINILANNDLKPFSWGIYLPYLGVITSSLGLKTKVRLKVRTKSGVLRNKDVKVFLKSRISKLPKKSQRSMLYRSLIRCIDLGADVFIYSLNSRSPSFRHITYAISKGACVIALVSAKEYYGIEECWGHMVAIIPLGTKSFKVIDPYERMGEKDYGSSWEKYLTNSRNYKWERWSSDMLEVFFSHK